MLLPVVIYVLFCFTATGGIYWIALETHGRRAAVISGAVTLLLFLAIGWGLLRFVIPELEKLTL